MEYFEKVLKKTGLSSLVTSIIFAILGIILITNPEKTVKFVSYFLGAMLILVGIYRVIDYIANKGKEDLYNCDLAFGVIAVIIGIIVIVYSSQIGSLFRILIGLWIVYSSIIRMNLSFKLKSIQSNIWIYSLVISLIMLACGIFSICNQGAIVTAVGIIILIYSILDIAESIIFLNNVKKIS